MINDYFYRTRILGSILTQNAKKKFIKSYKMSKALVDIEYFQVNSWLKKSTCEHNLQQDVESKQTLIECLNNLRCSNDRRIIQQLGNREFMLGNFEESLSHLQSYLKINPNCKNTQIQIAQLEFRVGKIQEAEQKVLQFIHAHDAAVNVVNNGDAGEDGQAGVNAQGGGDNAQLDEDSLLVLYSLMVQIQYALKNQDKLIVYIGRILDLQPNDSFALIYQADLLMSNPDKRDAQIAQLKMLRQQIYRERHTYSKQTFQDLVQILQKYDEIILRE